MGKDKIDCIEKEEFTSKESIELIKRIWHFFGTSSNIYQQQNLGIQPEIIHKVEDLNNLDILLNPKNHS